MEPARRFVSAAPKFPSLGFLFVFRCSLLSTARKSQLDVIVQKADLLAGLEGWHADVRTPVAPEGIAEGAVAARADLALHGEVDLGEVVHAQLERLQLLVGVDALGGVLGRDLLGQAARAVLAGAAALADLGDTLRSCVEEKDGVSSWSLVSVWKFWDVGENKWTYE